MQSSRGMSIFCVSPYRLSTIHLFVLPVISPGRLCSSNKEHFEKASSAMLFTDDGTMSTRWMHQMVSLLSNGWCRSCLCPCILRLWSPPRCDTSTSCRSCSFCSLSASLQYGRYRDQPYKWKTAVSSWIQKKSSSVLRLDHCHSDGSRVFVKQISGLFSTFVVCVKLNLSESLRNRIVYPIQIWVVLQVNVHWIGWFIIKRVPNAYTLMKNHQGLCQMELSQVNFSWCMVSVFVVGVEFSTLVVFYPRERMLSFPSWWSALG